MSNDDRHSGIPTRAIHEAYLDMQRALKRYRQAKDHATQAELKSAHGDVQEAVLTFYDMLRPHIKSNDAVRDYWEGELPSYPQQNGDAPDPEDGKGVLQVQNRYQQFEIPDRQQEAFVELETLEEWHDALGMNGNVRLTGVHAENGVAFVNYDAYQIGMRQLDGWETEYRTKQTTIGGFLGGKSETTTERVRVDMPKLKRAARELSDIAKELELLQNVKESRPLYHARDDDEDHPEPYGTAETPN